MPPIGLITLGNLRGVRESGNIFAIPTYLFLFSALLMIGIGALQARSSCSGRIGCRQPRSSAATTGDGPGYPAPAPSGLRRGSVALTGTEAIANGVPAFKPPESKNAANDAPLVAMLLGIALRGDHVPRDHLRDPLRSRTRKQSVIAQVARTVYGDTLVFYFFQLVHGADPVPRREHELQRLPAARRDPRQDGYFPRQFGFRGDRLAFTTGILILGLWPPPRSWPFGADTHLLIPLYSVGVFVSFTISRRAWSATGCPRAGPRLAAAACHQRARHAS